MSLAANLARAGNTKASEYESVRDAAAKEKGKVAARIHDEVRSRRNRDWMQQRPMDQ